MLAQLDQHPGFRDTPGKLRRLYELINNLGTIWGETQLRSSTTVGDTGPVSRYPVRRLKVAANSLVNARMNKKRQLCWTPIGAHRVLQVGAAVADGRLKQAKLDLAA